MPGAIPREQQQAAGPPVGTTAAGGTRIQDPGNVIAIDAAAMAVPAHHGSRFRMRFAQSPVARASGKAMTVLDCEHAAGQRHFHGSREPFDHGLLVCRPALRGVDIARDGHDPSAAGRKLVENARRADVTGVDDKIRLPNDRGHPRIEEAMGVGDEGDDRARFGHTLARSAGAEIITTCPPRTRTGRPPAVVMSGEVVRARFAGTLRRG